MIKWFAYNSSNPNILLASNNIIQIIKENHYI